MVDVTYRAHMRGPHADRPPVIRRTRKAGVPDEKVYVDPLVMSVATDTNACLVTLATMRAVLAEFPKASFHLGRSVFFRSLGNALPIASRTILRCTPTFFATPAIVPIPNSYSRRICSNNSTFALQSNESPPFGFAQIRVPVRLAGWAKSNRRTGPDHTTEITDLTIDEKDRTLYVYHRYQPPLETLLALPYPNLWRERPVRFASPWRSTFIRSRQPMHGTG